MPMSKFDQECILGTHNDTVHDIAWAPCMGRSFHLIATASREPTFQVDSGLCMSDIDTKMSILIPFLSVDSCFG